MKESDELANNINERSLQNINSEEIILNSGKKQDDDETNSNEQINNKKKRRKKRKNRIKPKFNLIIDLFLLILLNLINIII